MKINFCLISLFFIVPFLTQTQDAKDIVVKADNKIRGKSSYSEMSISIVRPKWQKTMEMKNWSIGNDFAVSLVTSPAKERGTVFLKRKNEAWNYLPSL